MKDLLTIRIVSALKEGFNEHVLIQLKQEKRKTLALLYKWIRSKSEEEEWNRAEIYLRLFKKKWTKENDYLLRNELKLLKDKIENYYVLKHQENYLQDINEKIKIEFYKEIKIADEFVLNYKNFIDAKLNQLELNDCLTYSFYYAGFIRINTPNYQERAKLLSDNLVFFEDTLHQYISQQKAKFNLMQSHVLFQQKQHHNKENKIHFEYASLNINTIDYQNVLSDYYIAYANAYVNFDSSTIEAWENVYDLLKKIPNSFKDIQSEYCFTLSNLATICSIRLDFEKADYFFNILFTTIDLDIVYQNIATSLNYITNLNKLQKYSSAETQLLKLIQRFGTAIKKYSQYRTQEIVVACYLYDSQKLGKLLAVDFETLQPFERIFYRLFYCIYCLKEEQFELAYTEIQNLQRSKLINEIDSHFNLIADFFSVCIKYLNTFENIKEDSGKSKNQFKKLNKEIVESDIPMLLNYAPYLWMKERMKL